MRLTTKIYTSLLASFVMMMATTSCEDRLDEQPRSVLTPEYFTTSAGLQAGVTAAYARFRYFYGNEGGMNMTVYGTDEYTHAQQTTNPPLNVYDDQLNPSLGDLGAAWNNAYPAINTCNGIIELGSEATDLEPAERNALIAEAKFIRAQWYFILVQLFGGVTLDLGSGPLQFNTSTENFASRATLAESYDAIVDDLVSITDGGDDDLPDARPADPGRAWKASALHLLSKVYLTRGWSDAAQSDDFQKAYDTATELINNKVNYGVDLLPDFAQVHAQGNEWSSETLWQVNWIDNVTFNNNTAFGGPGYQNRSNFFFNPFYEQNTPGVARDVEYGRVWVRYCPTSYTTNIAFADKINDTRYDKSFRTVWYVNDPTRNNPKSLELGDTAIWMVPDYLAGEVEPTINERRYVVFTPTEATDPVAYFGEGTNYEDYDGYNEQNKYYPALLKFLSTQPREGNDPNVTSVRPFIVYRFAETYLIAAEAALQLGDTQEAADLINVIRTRAAAPGAEAIMTANTLADLQSEGIDYILDERTRELVGEQMRWFDLVRTDKLIERVNRYNDYPARPGAIIPDPQPFHTLRPIPQGQIDASVNPEAENGQYRQNPGY